jgi:hypothetical protein
VPLIFDTTLLGSFVLRLFGLSIPRDCGGRHAACQPDADTGTRPSPTRRGDHRIGAGGDVFATGLPPGHPRRWPARQQGMEMLLCPGTLIVQGFGVRLVWNGVKSLRAETGIGTA